MLYVMSLLRYVKMLILYFMEQPMPQKYEDNPTVKKEWLKKGALVISASALLVDTDFLSDKDVKLIADNYEMYDEWGEGQPLPTQKNVSTLLGMGFYDAVREKKIIQRFYYRNRRNSYW